MALLDAVPDVALQKSLPVSLAWGCPLALGGLPFGGLIAGPRRFLTAAIQVAQRAIDHLHGQVGGPLQCVRGMPVAEDVITLLITGPFAHQRYHCAALQESEAKLLIHIGRHG
jgi:hypothetical protein